MNLVKSLCQEYNVLSVIGLDYHIEYEKFCGKQTIIWLEDIMEKYKK